MTRKLRVLVKIRLISQMKLNINALKKGDKRTRKQIMITFVIGLGIFMGAFYSGATAYGFELMGLGGFIPVNGFVLASLISLFFTVFKANGELFGFKDYDTLMSLPIKTSTVIASRFMYLYMWNTLFTVIIMMPMGIIYAVNEKPHLIFYPLWLISLFFIPMIPTTLATIIGALVTAIASKSRQATMMSTLLMLCLPILLFCSSLFFGQLKQTIDFKELDKIYQLVFFKLLAVYPVAKWYQQALIDGNIISFILFIFLSVGWYYVFIKLLSLKYKTINTELTSVTHRHNYQINQLRSSTVLVALYKKELKRLLTSPIYVTNVGLGLIIAFVGALSLMMLDIEQIASITGLTNLDSVIPKVAPFLLGALIGLSCTSCVSLSLEGKNRWLIQTLPITRKDFYLSKVLVNLTFTIPVAIICGIMLSIGIKASLSEAMMILAIPCAFALFTAIAGLVINYRFVNYDWETEAQVVKQSISSMLGMSEGLILAIILGVPTLLLSHFFYLSYCLLVLFFLLISSRLLYKWQIKKGI